MKKILFLALATIIGLAACRKDSETTDVTITDPPGPIEYVKASIGGAVINEAGAPVPNAIVRLAGSETTTDQNGVFRFVNKTVPSKAAYVKVEHPAYFHGSRTIAVSPNSRNTVRIQLLSNADTRFVDATAGGTADYTDYSIGLQAGGVVTASGADYTGQVGVAAKWLDPTDPDFCLQMPGQLRGITTDGQSSGMVSMGMMAVELHDQSGQKLQVKPGREATVRMKVPAALLGSAPATIPLWYFNEEKGTWVEEGQATLNGNFYEGKVAHFTFWNHDYKDPLVEIKFKVVDSDGNLIEGAKVSTQLVSTGQFGYGYTDNNGEILGLVPQNEVLKAEIYAPIQGCTAPILEEQIGPFSSNGTHTFTVNLSSLIIHNISGTLVNCDNAPVTNGYIQMAGSNEVTWTDAQGNFELQASSCTPQPTAQLTGFDIDALKQTLPATFPLDPNGGNISVGTIQACDALQNYLIVSRNGFNVVYPDASARMISDTLTGTFTDVLSIFVMDNQGFGFSATIPGADDIGTYPAQSIYAADNNTPGVQCWQSCSVNFTITEHGGSIGTYVAGSFAGTVDDDNGQPVAVSGSFRLLLQ
ncbi:MAG: carboxypeptidase-like regulatory domain-containing protein [Saprospiraceae bacterium]